MIVKFLVFILLINFRSSFGQSLSCTYRNDSSNGYTCDLTIQNPNGFNNFTSIGGVHLTGMTDNDVLYIARNSGSTTNVPSIICDKFQSLITIKLSSSGIQMIDDKAFKNCKKLQILWSDNNKISKIDENALVENLELKFITFNVNQLSEVPEKLFKNLHKLNELRLCSSPLPDLPKNIFNSLEKLTILHLESNKLKDLRIEWFLPLTNLQTLLLEYNLIEELPRNIFMSMKNLNGLTIYNNKLTVIHSDSFRGLSKLKSVSFQNNQINAFDEKFIDSTAVQVLDIRNNICANQSITDTSIPRTTMRLALEKCFKNFDDSLLARVRRLEEAEINFNTKILDVEGQNQQLTLTVNELNSKVINVTAENDKIRSEMLNITKKNEEMRVNFEKKIEDLVKENEEQNSLIKGQGLEIESLGTIIEGQESLIADIQDEFKHFRNETEEAFKNQEEALKNLENELLIWTTRPCSCH